MIKNEKQTAAAKAGTRLMVGSLPYAMEKSEFAASFTPYDLYDLYLSGPKEPGRNNAGWGIIAVDETAARHILGQTVLVGGRVARITRARQLAE
jgi:hypothetical protein